MEKEKLKEQYYNTAYSLWKMIPIYNRKSFNEYYEQYKLQCPFNKYCEIKERETESEYLGQYIREKSEIKKSKPKRNICDNQLHNKQNQKYFKFMRTLVLERDGYKCIKCGNTRHLEIHHLIERNKGGTDDISNLITLCPTCHAKEHKGQPVYNIMIKKANRLKAQQE